MVKDKLYFCNCKGITHTQYTCPSERYVLYAYFCEHLYLTLSEKNAPVIGPLICFISVFYIIMVSKKNDSVSFHKEAAIILRARKISTFYCSEKQ